MVRWDLLIPVILISSTFSTLLTMSLGVLLWMRTSTFFTSDVVVTMPTWSQIRFSWGRMNWILVTLLKLLLCVISSMSMIASFMIFMRSSRSMILPWTYIEYSMLHLLNYTLMGGRLFRLFVLCVGFFDLSWLPFCFFIIFEHDQLIKLDVYHWFAIKIDPFF